MVVGIRELSRDTSRIIKEFERTGEPVIVTREGQPIGALVAVDRRRLEDLVLATAPEFVDRRRRADEEVRDGETRSLQALAAERGIELPAESDRGAKSLIELAKDSTAEQLSPLDDMLAPEMMQHIKAQMADQVATLSAEMVEQVQRGAGAELEPDGVREVVELNTAISATLVRQELSHLLSYGGTDAAGQLQEALGSLLQRVRGIAGGLPEAGNAVLLTRHAFLAGARSGFQQQHAVAMHGLLAPSVRVSEVESSDVASTAAPLA